MSAIIISYTLCSIFFNVFPVHHCSCESMQYVIFQSSIILLVCNSETLLCWYSFLLFSPLTPLTSPSSFFFCPPLAVGSPYFSVISLLSNFSLLPFLPLLFLFPSTFFLLPLVSISPPGAGPQLCGVPVLLPTWAERLFPPGLPPGANDRPVPGQRQPLPHIQPQQQVGRTKTA